MYRRCITKSKVVLPQHKFVYINKKKKKKEETLVRIGTKTDLKTKSFAFVHSSRFNIIDL